MTAKDCHKLTIKGMWMKEITEVSSIFHIIGIFYLQNLFELIDIYFKLRLFNLAGYGA